MLPIKDLLMTKSYPCVAKTLGNKLLSTGLSSRASIAKLGMAGLLASLPLLSQVANAANNVPTTIPVDMSGINITQHEIAVMHVLSEICPPMLRGKQKQRFFNAYNTKLHQLMPTLDDPKAAIQYLSTQQDYREVLQTIRVWTMQFSKKDNQLLCQDMANGAF